MARRDSIHTLTINAAASIRKSLKARGINIPEVDDGDLTDASLRGLQELQAIARGLEEASAPSTSAVSTSETGKK